MKARWSNPARHCCVCLYRVGYGYRSIEALTDTNRSLAKRWVEKAGIKRAVTKKSRPGTLGRVRKPNTYSDRVLEKRQWNILLEKCRNGFWIEKRKRDVLMNTPERRKEKRKATYQRKKHIIQKRWSDRLKSEPTLRLIRAMRLRTWKTIKLQGGEKSQHWTNGLIGCNRDALLNHIQSQFTGKMHWNNYGTFWEVDHIHPCSAFDLTNKEEQRRCFHFSNLRPLTKLENRIKHAKTAEHQPSLLL